LTLNQLNYPKRKLRHQSNYKICCVGCLQQWDKLGGGVDFSRQALRAPSSATNFTAAKQRITASNQLQIYLPAGSKNCKH